MVGVPTLEEARQMMKNTILFGAALLSTFLIAAPHTALSDDGNLLADAGFELQLSPDQGGWTLFEQSSFSSDAARNGDYSMFNAGFSRSVAGPPYFVGTVSGSYQEFPASPESRWQLTGFGVTRTALKGKPAFGIVQLSFFDSAGNDLGTVETVNSATKAKTSNEINNQTPVGEWTFLDTGVATAPVGAASVQAFTIYVDFSSSNTAQGVYFDDLRLCVLEDDQSTCK